MGDRRWGLLAVALGTTGGPAWAGEPVEQMLDDLQRGLELTDVERALLVAEFEPVELHGAVEHARNLVWVAVTWDCRGPCLAGAVRAYGVGLDARLGALPSADLVLAELRDALADVPADDPLRPGLVAERVVATVTERTWRLASCTGR